MIRPPSYTHNTKLSETPVCFPMIYKTRRGKKFRAVWDLYKAIFPTGISSSCQIPRVRLAVSCHLRWKA